jgi:hypothetical protein
MIEEPLTQSHLSSYGDGFAQSNNPSKHVPTHATRNNTVEVFSSCPRMDRCYTTHAR